jgi:cold shock CspA family protein
MDASPARDAARAAVGPVPSAGPHLGRVTSFDPARGLGTVADDAGGEYGFHATAIADGSRRIEVGARVAFTVTPGHRGLYEARVLLPVPSGSRAG